jgi:hypothetical protein
MNSNPFKFTGDWYYDIELPSLAGFQERNGAYTSISSDKPNQGLFKVEFEDDLSDNQDPSTEQLNTFNFIIENQEKISHAICERTLIELSDILMDYGLENEEEYQNLNTEKIKSLIGLSYIHIKIIAKENYSYFDIIGGCNWDEEHGLNILFHKDRVVSFSGIDGGSIYEAKKDNGTLTINNNEHLQRERPKKYTPHPKYNKLKPSQKIANETYEYNLISYGYNDDFIRGIENGEIEINGKWVSQDKTYLEAACWFQNNQLVEYLLSKKAEIRYALHQCVGYGNNPEAMEMLLKNGADINFPYADGNTVLFEVVKSMESIYRSHDHYRKMNRSDLMTENNINQLTEIKTKIKNLIHIGADPYFKNMYGNNCFDIMKNSDEKSKIEVNEFLEKCWKGKRIGANTGIDNSGADGTKKSIWNSIKQWLGLTNKAKF